jgi:hypothetical protein
MAIVDTLQDVGRTLGSWCPEPIGAAVLVHPLPGGRGRLRRLLGSGRADLGARLGTVNQLVLTPTSVRLYRLGGRTGRTVKEELACWPLGAVRVDSVVEERSSWFAGTGSTVVQQVHRLRITGPGLDLELDAMADAGLDDLALDMLDDAAFAAETDPDVREGMAGLREISEETAAMVGFLVAATGGSAGPAGGGWS